MGELNASYLQPQIKDIDKVIKYRSQLYNRYRKTLAHGLQMNFQFVIRFIININIITMRLLLF